MLPRPMFCLRYKCKKRRHSCLSNGLFSSVLHNQENASPSTLTSNEKCDCHSQRTTFNVFFAYSEGNRQDADRTWRALIGCRASQSSSSLLGIHFFSESFRIQHNYIYFLSSGLVFLNLNSAW